MSGRNAQVARILVIIDLLDSSRLGMTVAEIRENLIGRDHEASKRTVYRDLQALLQAGFPLICEGKGEAEKKWRLKRTAKVNQYLLLTARELFALFLARGALAPLQNTPFYQDLECIFKKLEDRLGEKQIEYLESLEQEFRFDPGPAWGLGIDPDTLETLRSACSEGHVVTGVYSSVNSKTERKRRLGPHYLYYAKGGLYLVAEDLEDKKMKVFAVPRFQSAEMTEEAYEAKIVTPESFFQGSMSVFNGTEPEEIVIEFDESASPYVKERRWHSSQRITNLKDKRIRLTLELGSTPELVAWILSFGPSAQVVKPKSLAIEVAKKAAETTKLYKRSG